MSGPYSHSITWKQIDGITTLTVSDCESPEQARRAAEEWARQEGWRPHRWWQFWRWGE